MGLGKEYPGCCDHLPQQPVSLWRQQERLFMECLWAWPLLTALVHLCKIQVWSVLGRIMAVKALAQQSARPDLFGAFLLESACVLPLQGVCAHRSLLWHHWASCSQSRCFGPCGCHCSTWQGAWITILTLQSCYSSVSSPSQKQKLWTHRDLSSL